MFREMRRKRRQVSGEICREILKNGKRAVLSVAGDDGYPYGVPVNYYYDEEDGKIYLHGAKEGHRADAVRRCSKVCFTVWNDGTRKEGEWWWRVTSVIAMGRAEFVEDPEVIREKLMKMALKYYPDAGEAEKELSGGVGNVLMTAITVEHMTGKEIAER